MKKYKNFFYSPVAVRFLWKCTLLGGIFVFFVCLTCSILYPELPSPTKKLLFYSNQTGDDLKRVYHHAIRQAKHALFLQIYGLSDPTIIQDLLNKTKENIPLSLFYDPSGSGALYKKIPQAVPIKGTGLMHKKILVLDHSTILLGTANLTPTSLCMHDNIVIGMYHPELANFLENSNENKFSFYIENHPAIFWHLPDFQKQCLTHLLHKIRQAKESIYLSLFTFTHPQIVQALLQAHKRGVQLHIAIDSYAAKGSSKASIETLTQQGLTVRISQGRGQLLHHKWALIDHSSLLLGSANWTLSAFAKNDDCLLSLDSLTKEENLYFMKIWKNIELHSILSTDW